MKYKWSKQEEVKGLQVKEAINDTLVSLKFAIELMLLHNIYKLLFLQAWYLEES